MIELAPVCREDLVMLPKELARLLGGIGPLVIVYKISKFIHIVDINTMQTFEVDQMAYWKSPFKALLSRERLTEFIVLDIEEVDTNMNDSRAAIKQKFRQVRVEVARTADFGVNCQSYSVVCHLGSILNYNDTVLAYDLEQINCQEIDDFRLKHPNQVPEVIIVKKVFPKYRKKQKKRAWKLKHLDKEEGIDEDDEQEQQYEAKKAPKKKKHYEKHGQTSKTQQH